MKGLTMLIAATVSLGGVQTAPEQVLDTHRFRKAVREGDVSTVDRMLKADPGLASLRNGLGVSVVIVSVYHGQPEVTKSLLKSNRQLDVFEASATGNASRLKELLSKYPSMANEVFVDNNAPLHLAVFFGHYDAAQVLLSHKANPNYSTKDENTRTPLHSACACADLKTAEKLVPLLLKHKANPNLRQEGGLMPIHEAAARGSIPMVRALLQAGSKLNEKTKDGKTPLALARERNLTEMVTFLKSKGGKA